MTVIRRVPLRLVGNALLFQAVWFSAVLGAAHGYQWPVAIALVALAGWSACWRVAWREEARLVLSALVVGLLAEMIWLSQGLVEYRLQHHPLWPPAWILMLWAGFALTLNQSLAWLQQRWWLATLFGGLGGAGSMFAGVRLGAADAPQGLVLLLLVYGAVWALLVPVLVWWARRGRHASEPDERSMIKTEGA